MLLWRFDTITFTHLIADTFTMESKNFHINYIRYHLNYFDRKYPSWLFRFIIKDKIIEYLDNLELKVNKTIAHLVEYWKKSDKECQAIVIVSIPKSKSNLKISFQYVKKSNIWVYDLFLNSESCTFGCSFLFNYE